MKKRRNLNAFLNIAIAALSVTAVFTVLTTLELETSDTPPISLGTSITVISESEPLPFSESGIDSTAEETPTMIEAASTETTPPETAATTAPLPVTVAQTMPLAATNEENSPSEMDFSGVIEDVETEAETTAKTTVPSVKTTTTKATTKKVLDLELHEETEPDEFQLYEEFEEEQSLIIITLPTTTTTAATTTTPATSFITGYTDPTTDTTTAATLPNTPAVIPGSEKTTATVNGSRATYDTYDLVCGIVNAEIGSIFDDDAIKAQAVAAYTYLKFNEQNGTTASVYYKANYSDRIKQLTAEVYGQAVYYDGKYAQTVYAASTAGTTASAKTVWNINLPYLVSVQAPHDIASDPHYGLRKSFSVSEIKNALESYLNITLSDNPQNWLTVTGRVDGSYVSALSVDGQKTVTGRQMRENIMDFDLKSAAFDVTFDGQNFVFTTYGYGHGVGLSQYGANILAEQGYSYIQILKFYYSGVEIR
jgi:stage II sporulation protein D